MEDASSPRSLVQEVGNRGWYEKPTGRAVLELSSHVFLTASGIAVFLVSDVLWVRVLAMAVPAVGTMGHHLFPTVNHIHYPQLSLLVREHCRRRGVPYRRYTSDQAMWRTFKVRATPEHIEGRPEDLRLPRQASEAS